jgi:integrase
MNVKLWRALPLAQWPTADQHAFARACGTWRTRSRINIARTAFGQFLALCAREECSVDRDGVERFSALVQERLAGEGAHKTLRALADGLLALRPTAGEGWAWLLEANRVLLRKIRRVGTKPRYRSAPSLRIPYDQWPEDYKRRWQMGRIPPAVDPGPSDRYDLEALAQRAEEDRSGARNRLDPWEWATKSEEKARRGWGLWLWWVAHHDAALDPDCITPERVARYIDWHASRAPAQGRRKTLASQSLTNYAQELHMAARLLQPGEDWSWLSGDVQALAAIARPSQDKLQKIVPLEDLYLLGEGLADAACGQAACVRTALAERDGLMIATLCLMPKRLADFGKIRIGENLIRDENGDFVELRFERTKNGEASRAPVPKRLRPRLRRFVEDRRRLLDPHGRDELWLSEHGKPLGASGIYTIIATRTKPLGGVHPHLFRTVYATSVAAFDPDALPAVSHMLDHHDPHTTAGIYITIGQAAYASRHLDALTTSHLVRPPRGRKRRRRGPKRRGGGGSAIVPSSAI